MSGGWQLRPQEAYISDGNALSNSTGLFIPFPSTRNTYGPWTELSAGVPFDCSNLEVLMGCVDFESYGVVDLALGPSGSEEVIASSLGCQGYSGRVSFRLPVNIPAGTRVSARVQWRHDITSPVTGIYISTNFGASAFEDEAYQNVLLLADSLFIPPVATLNAKGPWSTLNSAVPRDIAELMFIVNNDDQNSPQGSFLIDIGVGPAGGEVVIIPNLPFFLGIACQPAGSLWYRKGVPSGMRIAARIQVNNTAYGIALSLYGVN